MLVTVGTEPDDESTAGREERFAQLRGRRLLVAVGHETNRAIVCHQATRAGMEVVTTTSAAETFDGMAGTTQSSPTNSTGRRCDRALAVVLLTAFGHRPPVLPPGHVPLTKPIKPQQLLGALVQAVTGEGRVRSDVAGTSTDEAATPLRILLAEDNELNQRLALAMLNRLGHDADVVGDGAQVLAAAARTQYDLILMDLQMPILDGLETSRRLIASTSGPRPRIVALTANATSADREACLAAGMDDYLAKPIELATLRQALDRCQPVPPSPIDHRRLAELGAEVGDPALVTELLEIFQRNAPGLAAAVPTAMSRGDAEEARRAVHTLALQRRPIRCRGTRRGVPHRRGGVGDERIHGSGRRPSPEPSTPCSPRSPTSSTNDHATGARPQLRDRRATERVGRR